MTATAPATTLIFVPTYNERDNVPTILAHIEALGLDADILFLDDDSPDGTGELLDQLAASRPRLFVVHRPGKLGIGSAHLDGLAWAYDHGYTRIVTMDCDFAHSPSDIPRLLEHAAAHPVVLGSRYLEAGSLPDWNLVRRFLTNLGHLLTRSLLQIPYDATGAFRVFDLSKIPRHLFARVTSRGYSFFFESLLLLVRNGFSVHEVAIVLPARTYGHSKMSLREARRSALRILELYLATRLDPGRFHLTEVRVERDPRLVDPQRWDAYWAPRAGRVQRLYGLVAGLYRNLVVRRRLNQVIRAHFPEGSALLHAGCGSGQVDADIQHAMAISAVDISAVALELYARNNPRARVAKQGSILDLPFPDEGFDGAYNLGVLEHFAEPEIRCIFSELQRVLRPGGKVVVFWPHRRAPSVLVLGAAHWLLNDLLGRGIRLHPEEVSLLRSRRAIAPLLDRAGFDLVDYYFGVKDLFVQAVIVGQKR